MESRRTNEQFHGNVFDLHPLYQLPVNMPQSVVTNLKNKIGWLYNREFAISPGIDWVKIRELGLTKRMAPYLMETFTSDEFPFICNGWMNVFAIIESIFKELCVEFFASISFEDATVDPYFARALVFALEANIGNAV